MCDNVKEYFKRVAGTPAAGNLRWKGARDACKNNGDTIRLLYNNLVKQIEYAGAPYTNQDVMLVLGSDLYGHSSTEQNPVPIDPTINWLFLRSFKRDIPNIKGWWQETLGANDLSGHGDANIYFSEGEPGTLHGIWTGEGAAWMQLFGNAADAGVQNQDRITFMATTKDEIDGEFLFDPAIKDIPFWMSGWSAVVDLYHVVGNYMGASWPMYGMKCFVGSGIKKVCSSEEWGAASTLRWASHDSYPLRDYWSLGWKDDNKGYAQLLGDFQVEYYNHPSDPWAEPDVKRPMHYYDTIQVANFWPAENAQLYRMPVLNVDQRACTESMVIANQGLLRKKYRPVSGNDGKTRNLPSRCGTDMDYFINQMIPRPVVSGLENQVRIPVFPAGMN